MSSSHTRPHSPTSLRSTGIISPIYAAATTSDPFTPDSTDLVTFRQIRADRLASLRHLMPLGGKPVPEVEEQDIWVPVRGGAEVRVRLYEPAGREDSKGEGRGGNDHGRPLILMFHEGGFVFGDLTDEEMNCRLFVRELGVVCGNVEYRLAPEHLFPTCTEDSWDVTKWFAENAASVGANLKKGFIVGGASAGGAIAGVLSQLSRMEGLEPPITGQYLAVPVIFPPGEVPETYKDEFLSPWENNSDPILKGYDSLVEHMKKVNIDTTSPMYTAISHPGYPPSASSTTRNMPPAYLQIAGLDPLRDHGLIYDRILREEYRVQTKVDLYSGFGHMFWTNWPAMKESHEFVDDTVRGMKWLLEQRVNVKEGVAGREDFTLR